MFFLTWIALCFVAALIAGGRGHSTVGFFFLSFFLSPLVGIIAAIFIKENTAKMDKEQIAAAKLGQCSFCEEPMDKDHLFCRSCGKDRPS